MTEHDLTSLMANLSTMLDTQTEQIFSLRETVDDQNTQLKNFVPKRRFRVSVGVILLVVVFAGLSGWAIVSRTTAARDEAIWRNACSLRGVLSLAQSSATRNPVPPGLGEDLAKLVEDSRKQATAFYAKSFSDIDATLETLGRGPCPVSPVV